MKVLFVCLGNICRSPAADGVFTKIVNDNKLSHLITVDSAGTSAYHAGEAADPRTSKSAIKRGYDLTSISRQFLEKDFQEFDMILTMDDENFDKVLKLAKTDSEKKKVQKFTKYCTKHELTEVPDPYESDEQGFEFVMDMMEDGCENLFKEIRNQVI